MATGTLTSTPLTTSASARSRALTADECRSWLNTHGEGRLGYLSGRGERNVVVAYAVNHGDEIVLRVPAYNEITQYVPGRQVTLEVTGLPEDGMVERVLVTGHASVRPDIPVAVLSQLPNEHWPDELTNVVVSVPLEKVDGQVVGDHVHPHGPAA
jgi:hypothetical protein